jgi:hypothetical protein
MYELRISGGERIRKRQKAFFPASGLPLLWGKRKHSLQYFITFLDYILVCRGAQFF